MPPTERSEEPHVDSRVGDVGDRSAHGGPNEAEASESPGLPSTTRAAIGVAIVFLAAMGNMVGLFYKNLGKSHGLDHEFNRAFQHHSRVKSRYQGQGSQSAPGSGNAWNQHHEQPGQQAKQEGRQAEQHQAKQRQGRRQEQDQKASNSTSEDEHTRWQAHFEGVIRMPADPYAVLGLDRNATNEQIKWRYRQLAKMTHPDTVQSPVEKAVAEGNFKLVSRAYEQLRASRGIGDASMK